ncbi:MAG TPA: hypothetical protein VFT54_03125 [Acidimicrobiia bacterium]|nr:hypothetical protein [Acidimicrobiia bacterium]
MTTATLRTMRLGAKDYPLILPNVRDPRLHLAAVIISIHILGQTVLGFRVTVPQILAAILSCFLIEVVITFGRTREIVWPASAMLTGSGVGLIFRVVGTERGDHWGWDGWFLFALVAGLSLITKYVIRYRASHVFNPSNVGLVVAFLVLGSTRVEPLDFWWAPFDGWMAAAYLIILGGGLLITARLKLLEMAATFWLVLAAGLGLVAASGHCMTAAWALGPVCGGRFWWVVVSSPEILIFLFFMITDPKTIPVGRAARVSFAVVLALVSILLIAPQSTEFGAKVGLLASLVVLSPMRQLFDRLFRQEPSQQTGLARLTSTGGVELPPWRVFSRGAVLGVVLAAVAIAIVAAGSPARVLARSALNLEPTEVAVEIDPASLPAVTVDEEVAALNSDVAGSGNELALALAENLAIEGEAMRRADPSLLRGADDGERLIEFERRIEAAATAGELAVTQYAFDSLHLHVVQAKGPQGGASLALDAQGVIETITYDAQGVELYRTSADFASTFVLRQGSGERWLIAAELPLKH